MSAQAAHRVKEIIEELSRFSLAELSKSGEAPAKLVELDTCLNEVRGFAHMVEAFIEQDLEPSARFSSVGSRGPRRRSIRHAGRRGPGEFKATSFILKCVEDAGTAGIRNTDIAAQVAKARPDGHVRRSALVSTTLRRLKARGEVTRRQGKWYTKK